MREELTNAQEQIVDLHHKIDNSKDENERKDHLLKKAAIKDFERGLEYNLSGEHEKSFDEYRARLELDPTMYGAQNNWGLALFDQAKEKSDVEADALFAQAYEKYGEALKIKPDMHDALNNWGSALSYQARLKTGKAVNMLHTKAFEALLKAVSLGGCCYNFACVNVLQGDKGTAYQYLDEALGNKVITVEFVEKDDDWISLREEKDYIEILNKYR